MRKRFEKKHSRVVKGFDSGATFLFVDITNPTFSLQYAFLSQTKFEKLDISVWQFVVY